MFFFSNITIVTEIYTCVFFLVFFYSDASYIVSSFHHRTDDLLQMCHSTIKKYLEPIYKRLENYVILTNERETTLFVFSILFSLEAKFPLVRAIALYWSFIIENTLQKWR